LRRAVSAWETWTCEASDPLPSNWAELTLAPVAAAMAPAGDWEAVVTGQNATSPEAAAAVRTVEPVTAIVSFEGFPCRGV
jgi:hypothetical protein